jgi:hypothetical protein
LGQEEEEEAIQMLPLSIELKSEVLSWSKEFRDGREDEGRVDFRVDFFPE